MLSHELHSLLAACKDAPDDDAPRLVLADWLEEHGDADRAEFVRLSVRHAPGEVERGDEAVALARLHALYSRNATRWLGVLQDLPMRFVFQRGLLEARADVERLRLLGPYAPAHALPWMETLVLQFGRQATVGDLLETDELRHFTGLDLTGCKLSAPWLEKLGDSPRAAHLRRLRLATAGPPKTAGEALAGWKRLVGLRAIELPDGLGESGLVALAGAPALRQLSSFALRFGNLRKGAVILARSPHAPRLTRLTLDYVEVGAAGLSALALSGVFGELAELTLESAALNPPDVEALASRPRWPHLRRLSLTPAALTADALSVLGATEFPALRWLDLRRCRLDPPALAELLSAPWISGLERLDLANNPLGDAGAAAVAGCAALANLRHLDLSACDLAAEGVRALADSPHLSRLRSLGLNGNLLSNAGVAALAGCARLPCLDALALSRVQMTGVSLRGLSTTALDCRGR